MNLYKSAMTRWVTAGIYRMAKRSVHVGTSPEAGKRSVPSRFSELCQPLDHDDDSGGSSSSSERNG